MHEFTVYTDGHTGLQPRSLQQRLGRNYRRVRSWKTVPIILS